MSISYTYQNQAIAPTPTPEAERPRRLRLLSYNIQAGTATRRYHHYVTHSYRNLMPSMVRATTLEGIGALVRDYDIVGLQETDAGSLRSGFINQTRYLAEQGRFPHWYQQSNRKVGKFAHVANGVLSRLQATEVHEHRLPGTIPGRGALRVTYGSGENALTVIVVHLALGKRARLNQVAHINELIADLEHVVVMGDMNTRASSPELKLLQSQSGLRNPIAQWPTYPSWRPYRNIDHIFISDDLHVQNARVLNCVLSDHRPVALEISLPGAVGTTT